jgi:hypothetical protein
MIVQRGKNAYRYQSIRENGEPKTLYKGKISSQELREHEQRKEETQQYQQREQELDQLNKAVNQALSALDMMKRAQLLTIGLYTRRSEIRTLQEEARCHTTMN